MAEQPIVLHVLEALEGGTARHAVDVVRHASGVRHEVVLPAERVGGVTDRAAPDAMRAAGASVHLVEMRRSTVHPINVLAIARVRRLIAERQPDVVHGHSSIGGAIGRMAALGSGAVRFYTPNGLLTSAPVVAAERLLGRVTDRFIAVSPSEGDLARRLGLVSPPRLVVVANGIDLSAVPASTTDLRDLLGLPAETPLVGCIARLLPQKAPEDYVRLCAVVAARRADVHFVLIGSGPLEGLVQEEVARAGLGRNFHRIAELPIASAVLGQLQVFALPSRFEGGPYTPLEAMRAGTPVVLSDAVGNRDAVEHGRSGFIAPVGDVAGMADGVLRLLNDGELRTTVVEAAHRRLAERFDVRVMGAALAEEYRLATPERHAASAQSVWRRTGLRSPSLSDGVGGGAERG